MKSCAAALAVTVKKPVARTRRRAGDQRGGARRIGGGRRRSASDTRPSWQRPERLKAAASQAAF
jgi:hypothetical protein